MQRDLSEMKICINQKIWIEPAIRDKLIFIFLIELT